MHDGAMWYRPYATSHDYAFRCLDCKERFPIKHPHVRQKTYDPYSGKYHIKCRECATKQADMFEAQAQALPR